MQGVRLGKEENRLLFFFLALCARKELKKNKTRSVYSLRVTPRGLNCNSWTLLIDSKLSTLVVIH